jgi:hypothetical protein
MGFILSFGGERGEGGEEDFFYFSFVPAGSQCVPHGFYFKFWGGGGKKRKIFFIFFCSNRFPMCSPRVLF